MGSRLRLRIAECVEAVGTLALRFAGPASDFVDERPYTRRVASWMAEEWS